MNNNVKAKGLLYVCIALFLATTLAVGVSYALFSDSVQVQNHLEAGTLDVTLKRTSLSLISGNSNSSRRISHAP